MQTPARNASADDWRAHADAAGINVPADATRADIIAAVELAAAAPSGQVRVTMRGHHTHDGVALVPGSVEQLPAAVAAQLVAAGLAAPA